MPPVLRVLRPLLVLVGLAFIAYLVWEMGPATVWETIRALSWRLALVMCVPYAFTTALDTLAWRIAIVGRDVPFVALWGARAAGEAVNVTTPTASMGGEPVKAFLVRPWVPLGEGLASVVLDKTTIVLGQGVFLSLGLALASTLLPPGSPLLTGMAILLALQMLAVGGFVLVQLRGAAGTGGRLLARLGLGPGATSQARLDGIDRSLSGFYRHRRRRLLAAVLCHALAWGVGSLEIYLVLNFLGLPVPLLTAVVMESFGTAVKFATFVIPGSLGALEGSNVAIFAAFGWGGAVGLSYTLVRRLREATWVAVGLVAMAVLGRPRAAPAPR